MLKKKKYNPIVNDIFGTLPVPTVLNIPCQEEVGPRKEPTMYNEFNTPYVYNDTENGKEALMENAESVFFQSRTALKRKYGLLDNEAPSNAQQLVDAIKNNQYVLSQNMDEGWFGNYFGIQWRDPSKVKDTSGFEAAYKTVTNQYKDLSLLIKVSSVADGYAAFKTFKANVEASYA
jgi:hypothetical protein